MRTRSFLLLLTAGVLLTSSVAGADSTEEDQARLRAARLPTDPPGLVQFLRLRTQREPSRETLRRVIEALHAPTPAARLQAHVELVAVGKPALPLLRAVVVSDRQERARIRACIKALEGESSALTIAAVHVLAHQRTPGTAGELLTYLPYAENEQVLEEIQEALNALTYDRKGAADAAVVAALSDKHPSRRAAAVVALAQGNVWQHREELRKLLGDPAPPVQFRAARALTRAADPDAVATMISLLGDPDDGELCAMVESFLSDLAGDMEPKAGPGDSRKGHEVWARWWRDTDTPALLDDLKSRTPSRADRERAQVLIQKLGDGSYSVRQKALKELIQLEERALPLLKQAVKTPPDLEIRKRSEQGVAAIEKSIEKFRARLPVLARLIALRKPPGAVETILAYLPFLDDEGLSEELRQALGALALSGGKPRAALLQALTDASAVRRAAAAQALCAGRQADLLAAVRKLLKDPDPAVRLKVAAALAQAGDRAGVPVLIALVAELPGEQSVLAEDALSQLVGDAAPESPGGSEEDRKARSAAWADWWKTHQDRVTLLDPALDRFASTLSASVHGYTLLVQPQNSSVTELGRDGKPRWALTGLLQPRDAVVLPGQHVAVVEQGRVTERDLRGKILWQKDIQQPLSVQRLRNGNLFITCQNQLLEIRRSGKEVQRIPVTRGVVAAHKLPDGRIVAFSFGNEIVQLDRAGRELKRTPVNCGGAGCNEVLENGHVLALSPGNGNIIEFDMDGDLVNRFDVQGAAHGFRLPNGHTLVTVNGTRYIELDRKWRPIKETMLPAAAFRVKRR